MKNMKFGFFGALAIAAAMFFSGCTDACKDVTCVQGECVDGLCVCDAGYEGTDCGTALNAKFSGTYALTETCTSGADAYTATFTPKSASQTEVSVTGFYREATPITATVGTDGLSFSIARQTLLAGFDIEATSGTITAAGTTINVTYTVYPTGSSTAADQCTATLTK